MRDGIGTGVTVMLVEDDPATSATLTTALEASGYRVTAVGTGADAKAVLEAMHPDLIILDLMLPDTDGLVLTSSIKAVTDAPIVILSARQEQVDRVLGLKLGADDFVAKPFDLDELEARLQAVLRRAARSREAPPSAAPSDVVRVGELAISQSRGTVTIGGQAIHLTPTEYRLVVALATHPDEVLSREMLGQTVWGYQDVGTGHLIDVHIGRLRLKLRRASRQPPVIVTVRGRGYRMVADTPPVPGVKTPTGEAGGGAGVRGLAGA
jgi:two-component system, OmpR family, response regulator